MSKFNPEDFKAPEMKPLSDVTVNGSVVEWDKIKDGVIVPFFKGNIRLVDGKATYNHPKGKFGDGEFSVELDIEDNDIDADIGVIKSELECLEGWSKLDKELSLLPEDRPSREDMTVGHHVKQAPTPECAPLRGLNKDFDGHEIDLALIHGGCGSRIQMQAPKPDPVGVCDLRGEHNLNSSMEMSTEARGKISEIDSSLFSKPITKCFAQELREANYYRECSCKSCGAPINFYRVSAQEYADARCKGNQPNNFTDEELESLFGEVGEIDGVIYDDSRLCSQCRSYEC